MKEMENFACNAALLSRMVQKESTELHYIHNNLKTHNQQVLEWIKKYQDSLKQYNEYQRIPDSQFLQEVPILELFGIFLLKIDKDTNLSGGYHIEPVMNQGVELLNQISKSETHIIQTAKTLYQLTFQLQQHWLYSIENIKSIENRDLVSFQDLENKIQEAVSDLNPIVRQLSDSVSRM